MFGYLKPYKPELKMKEYECYKGFYCGLCRTLKKEYGLFSTFALSYDAAFLALLYKAMSKSDKTVAFERKRCVGCPLKKCTAAVDQRSLVIAADILVLTVYFKIKDAFSDRGFFEKLKYGMLYPFFKRYKKKAEKRSLMIYNIIEEGIERTVSAEKNNAFIDEAADGTAYMMAGILELFPGDREKNYRFGYMLGRFIYFCDAADDLKKDIKSGNFNPLKQETTADVDKLLDLSVASVIDAYREIELYDMKSIPDNLVYLGLSQVVENLKSNERKEK